MLGLWSEYEWCGRCQKNLKRFGNLKILMTAEGLEV